MFNAKVYKVMVGSLSGTMEEVYAAKETIRKWNLENAEREGKLFLPVGWSTNADDIKLVDVLIGIVGNRVENVGMVEDCIKARKQVMLFFCSYNDPKNTIPREQEDVLFLKRKVQESCYSSIYNGLDDLRHKLEVVITSVCL
jgi:hypothetical protein